MRIMWHKTGGSGGHTCEPRLVGHSSKREAWPQVNRVTAVVPRKGSRDAQWRVPASVLTDAKDEVIGARCEQDLR